MARQVSRSRWEAIALAAAAGLCVAVNVATPFVPLEVASALPLALLLPGSAVVLAADPDHAHIRGVERLVWSALGTIVTIIAGGLALNEISGLTRTTWLLLLLGVVAASSAIAFARAAPSPEGYIVPRGLLRTPEIRRSAALLSLGAVGLTAGAIALSIYTTTTFNQEHFVQLWIVPIPGGAGSTAYRAEVGVTNYEGHRVRFDVSVTSSRKVWLNRKTVVLDQGQSWTYDLVRKQLVEVQATVSLASAPSQVLHSVWLAAPAG